MEWLGFAVEYWYFLKTIILRIYAFVYCICQVCVLYCCGQKLADDDLIKNSNWLEREVDRRLFIDVINFS